MFKSRFPKKTIAISIAEIIKLQSIYIFDNAVLKEIPQCSNPQAEFNQIFIFETIFELAKISGHRLGLMYWFLEKRVCIHDVSSILKIQIS